MSKRTERQIRQAVKLVSDICKSNLVGCGECGGARCPLFCVVESGRGECCFGEEAWPAAYACYEGGRSND